jgi:hypothetical protein
LLFVGYFLVISATISEFCFVSADEVLEKILAMPPVDPAAKQIEYFSSYDGDWTVDDNGVITGNGSGKLVYDNETFKNLTSGEMSVDIFLPEADKNSYRNAGIILKISEPGSGADAFIGYEIALSPENRHVNIGLHRHNYQPIEQPVCDISTGKWFTLHVLFNETSFEVRLNEKTVAKYEDKTSGVVRSGGIALRPWQRSAQYRNLKIKKNGNDWVTVPFRTPPQIKKETAWVSTLETKNLPPVLFITRHPLTRPNSVGNDIWMSKPTAPGCSIRLMEPAQPEKEIRTVFSDPDGSIYDMNLSADAKTIYFSYRQRGENFWHLWCIGVDGNGLRQLTSGPYHDVSPCETPSGDLIFVSTRRFGYTVCQPGPSSNLHRLQNFAPDQIPIISCISMNTLSDFSPQMMSNGRVLFTRWEYIDRDLTFRQSLWTENPDGTGYQLFFGNTIRDVGTFWQARQIPEQRDLLLATFAPHHSYPHGMIGLIDRSAGIEGEKGKGFIYITKDVPSVGDRSFPWGYRDPFPLSDEQFLCSYGDGTGYYRDGKKRFALYLLNRKGEKRLLFEDKEQSCFFPIPLIAAPPKALVVDRVQPTSPQELNDPDNKNLTGTLILMNVNEGLQGLVEPGKIVALRIMEQIRKTEDLVKRAYDQSPVMSYGTYYAKRDWGTVPIEPDGSAHFVVPALREIYLQGLDSEGREVFRMTSALQVMPGERLSCTGCHENRDAAPVHFTRLPIAARKDPVVPKSPDWLLKRKHLNEFPDARVFDYPTVVQPVLDKYCISCHNGEKAEAGYDLTGDKTRFFSMSYDNLLGTSRSYRQHDMETGKMLQKEADKGKPLVHFFWLLMTPTSVSEPYITGSYAGRLTEIIESDHGGINMPLEDRQKIYYWMDANVPYYGTYAHARPNAVGRRDRFADPVTGQYSSWFSERFLEVYNRRCTECHGSFDQPEHRDWIGRYAWINLENPKQSAALTAHLTTTSGGRGIAAVKGIERAVTELSNQLLFSDTNDADYIKMRNAIEEGKRIMLENPEADMNGFIKTRPEP